jgi:hypothetical protein
LDLFADAAVSLANEPDARRALGERGRELYERHFAPAVVGRILQEKLEEHRRGHSSR